MNGSFFSVQYSEKPPKNAETLEEENSRLGSVQLSLADTPVRPVRPVPGCACRLKRKKIPRQRDWWDQLRQRWGKPAQPASASVVSAAPAVGDVTGQSGWTHSWPYGTSWNFSSANPVELNKREELVEGLRQYLVPNQRVKSRSA